MYSWKKKKRKITLWYLDLSREKKILSRWYKNISFGPVSRRRNEREKAGEGRGGESRGKRGREGSKGEKERDEVSQSDSSHPIFSRARRIESTSDILRRLVDVERTSSDLLIPTTILTAFVRWSLPGGMIGVVDDRVATPVCASNVCHARVLALSLSLYLPASRTPPYVCLCAKQGVEKGGWGERGRKKGWDARELGLVRYQISR